MTRSSSARRGSRRAIVALLALLAGCTEKSATAPFADVAGVYDIQSVNKGALPYALGGGNYLMRGSLTLLDDGHAIVGVYTQAQQTGTTPTFAQFSQVRTTFTRRDTTLVFASVGGIYFENGLGTFTAPGRLAITTVHVSPATGLSGPPVTTVYVKSGS